MGIRLWFGLVLGTIFAKPLQVACTVGTQKTQIIPDETLVFILQLIHHTRLIGNILQHHGVAANELVIDNPLFLLHRIVRCADACTAKVQIRRKCMEGLNLVGCARHPTAQIIIVYPSQQIDGTNDPPQFLQCAVQRVPAAVAIERRISRADAVTTTALKLRLSSYTAISKSLSGGCTGVR